VQVWDERFEVILRKHLPFLPDGEELSDELPLRDFGLDSMSTVTLLSILEREYQVKFLDDSLRMENFATPERIWSTIASVR
jgi:acyl carrier protein